MTIKRSDVATAVVKAIDRLTRSSTQLQRRNARRALQVATSRLLAEFPTLGRDGKPRPQVKRPTCPLCQVPLYSYAAMSSHLNTRHGMPLLGTRRLAAWNTHGILQQRVVAAATHANMAPVSKGWA